MKNIQSSNKLLSHHPGLFRSSVASVSLRVISIPLGFVLSVALARLLGPDGLGRYSFILTILTLLSLIVQMGLPTLHVREVAKYASKKYYDLLKGLIRRSDQAVIISSFLLLIILLLIRFMLNIEALSELSWIMYLSFLLVPLLALNMVRQGTLRGLHCPVVAMVPVVLIQPITFIVGLYLCSKFFIISSEYALVLHVLAAFIAFILSSLLLQITLPSEVRMHKPKYDTKIWAKSVLPLTMIAGISILKGQTDIFMLGVLSTDHNVGVYRVAFSGANLVLLTLMAINTVIAPKVAEHYASGNKLKLQRIISMSARCVLASSFFITVVFIWKGAIFIDLLYGLNYREAYPPLVILSLGQLFNAATGSVGMIMNMTGQEKVTLKVILFTSLFNVGLNTFFIPQWGVMGAVSATVATIAIENLALCWFAYKVIGIHTYGFYFKRFN